MTHPRGCRCLDPLDWVQAAHLLQNHLDLGGVLDGQTLRAAVPDSAFRAAYNLGRFDGENRAYRYFDESEVQT